ncbi:hypothetical protein [Actinomadura pelletieri]|nr:hypothetical protein [Actinomadura pelletieri]
MFTMVAAIGATAAPAGCGGDGSKASPTATVTVTVTADPAGGPAIRPTGRQLTAAQVLTGLRRVGMPIKVAVVYTARTDPNGHLGRPRQYTSKAACTDRRVPAAKASSAERGSVERGCGVEVYPTETGARARSEYIQQTLGALGGVAGSEYHYVRGGVLLRVSGFLTPGQAKQYETALARVTG